MVYLSLAARILVNVEALNMVESVGNVTRHRRATFIVPRDSGGYVKVEAPAISGETIAHAYQELLAYLALKTYPSGKAPLCQWCARGEFIKSADQKHTIPGGEDIKDPIEFEKFVIKSCLVEDIGGFLRAERPPSKRTSRFSVGYMIPTYDTIEHTVLESQFHARHVPTEALKEEARERRAAAQMIYYVETGSAVYGFNFNIDLGTIGHSSLEKVEKVVDDNDYANRVKIALDALYLLLTNADFGAKRTRFLPFIEIRSALAAISRPVQFNVLPPSRPTFIKDTAEKLQIFKKMVDDLGISEDVTLIAFSEEEAVEIPSGIESVGSIDELMKRVYEKVKALLNI